MSGRRNTERADGNPQTKKPEAVAENQTADIRRPRTEGDAHRHFAQAPQGGVGEHAIQTDRGEQEREAGEDREQK